jgi:hypothetical protein
VAHLCERWLKRIPHLAGAKLRVALVRTELWAAPPAEAAMALDALCQRADAFEADAREVLAALVPVVTALESLERVDALRELALAAPLPAAYRLLRASHAAGHLLDADVDEEAAQRGIPEGRDGRPLTLGERRALARKPSRATIVKLLRDPHPQVVRILLRNPRLREEDVVAMAARRPALAEVARELAREWVLRPRVRMALMLNPGTPPAVTVPALGLLSSVELDEVTRAADVPPVVRATARELAALRRPLAAACSTTASKH